MAKPIRENRIFNAAQITGGITETVGTGYTLTRDIQNCKWTIQYNDSLSFLRLKSIQVLYNSSSVITIAPSSLPASDSCSVSFNSMTGNDNHFYINFINYGNVVAGNIDVVANNWTSATTTVCQLKFDYTISTSSITITNVCVVSGTTAYDWTDVKSPIAIRSDIQDLSSNLAFTTKNKTVYSAGDGQYTQYMTRVGSASIGVTGIARFHIKPYPTQDYTVDGQAVRYIDVGDVDYTVPGTKCRMIYTTTDNTKIAHFGNSSNGYAPDFGADVIGHQRINGTTDFEIDFSEQPTQIGTYSFADAKTKLKTLDMTGHSGITGVNIKNINAYAFGATDTNNYALNRINMSNTVENIYQGAFQRCVGITGISFSNSLKKIDKDAFYSCVKLNFSTLPSSLQEIGDNAFRSCEYLTTFGTSNNLKTIGKDAFRNCNELNSFTIPKSVTSVGQGVLYDCSNLLKLYISSDAVMDYGKHDYNNDSFTSNLFTYLIGNNLITSFIYLPENGVTHVGESCFQGCTGVTVINTSETNSNAKRLPESIVECDDYPFYECGETHKLYNSTVFAFTPKSTSGTLNINSLASTIKQIAGGACRDCSSITSLTLPSNLVTIGREAFKNCSSIAGTVYIPGSVSLIGDSSFDHCSGITNIQIQDGSATKTIGNSEFAYCTSLNTLYIGNGVTSIWAYSEYDNGRSPAFFSCNALQTVTINSNYIASVNRTGADFNLRHLFGAGKVTTFNFGNSVTSIGDYAMCFRSNDSARGLLTHITIGTGVTSIGNSAFSYCTAISNWNLQNVETIGTDAFRDNVSATDLVFSNVVTIGDRAFMDCTGLKGSNGSTTELTIPTTCTTIGTQAFYRCTTIPKVIINTNVTTIGKDAFSYCPALKTVEIRSNAFMSKDHGGLSMKYLFGNQVTQYTLTNTITKIGKNAFKDNSGTTNITFTGNMNTIDNQAFYNASNFSFNGGTTTEITIPSHITTVNYAAFKYCSTIKKVNITSGKTYSTETFMNCGNLEAVTFTNTNSIIATESMYRGCKKLTAFNRITSLDAVGHSYDNNYITGYVEESAFRDCTNLPDITLFNAGVGSYAFAGCKLNVRILVSGNCAFGDYAFANTSQGIIDFEGSYSSWQNIVSNSSPYWKTNSGLVKVRCYDSGYHSSYTEYPL